MPRSLPFLAVLLLSAPSHSQAALKESLSRKIEALKQKWRTPERAARPDAPLPPDGKTVAEDNFHVNAQYRGTMKKSFEDIGRGNLRFMKLGEKRFQVTSGGKIKNPQKPETYEFSLDMTFRLDGDRIEIDENLNDFSNEAQGFKRRVERALPFLYLVRILPPPAEGTFQNRDYRYLNHRYSIRYARTGRSIEVAVTEDDRVIGKIFLARDSRTPFARMTKFRVPSRRDVMVSFVVD